MSAAPDLLLDLVAIPSVSPMSNLPVVDYVKRLLPEPIWKISEHHYTDSQGTAKTNLVALTQNGTGERAELMFVCHTDTVPFDAAWQEAVHPALRDGRIYGRGSCDVKSFLACVLAALGETRMEALARPVGLILTADEEVGCVGAKFLAQRKAISTRYLLIGEPTGLRPVRAGKGYGLATIRVRGREAHSAFPSAGRSAIYDAARVVMRLERLAAEVQSQTDLHFDPPFTTLNVGVIEGGTAKNIVPGECRMLVEWRPLPGQASEFVPRKIQELLDDLHRADAGLQATLEVQRTDPAFAPSAGQTLADLLASAAGTEATTISFGSEAAHLSGMAEETVVFGPGDMTVAHKTGEFVPVAELEQCVAYLKDVVTRLCSAA